VHQQFAAKKPSSKRPATPTDVGLEQGPDPSPGSNPRRVQPQLTPLAALGLGMVQLLAIGFHAVRGETAMTLVLLGSRSSCFGVRLEGADRVAPSRRTMVTSKIFSSMQVRGDLSGAGASFSLGFVPEHRMSGGPRG